MINRWGMAVFGLAMCATPLAAQEPSLEPSAPHSTASERLSNIALQPLPSETLPVDIDGQEDIWTIEPSVDVSELRTSIEALLPQTAPPPPAITHILPANTPAAMIANTRDDAWVSLKQYALFSQLSERFGIEPSPEALSIFLQLDYKEDLQPWVGDSIAFALLPVPSARTVHPVERSVTIVPIQDAIAFIDFIPTLAETRGELPEQISYRTFPIWQWPEEFVRFDQWEDFPDEAVEELEARPNSLPSELDSPQPNEQGSRSHPLAIAQAYRSYRQPEAPYIPLPDPNGPYSDEGFTVPGYAIAHLDNYIVIARTADTLRQWIEFQTQGAPTLTSNPSFEKTQNHPEADNSLATIYGNVGELVKFEFSNPFQNFGLPAIPQPSLSDRKAMSALFSQVTFDALIYPDTQGMHLEAHLYTEGALPSLPPSPNADHSILGLIPAATYMMGSGYDISGFWNDLSSAFSLNDVSDGLIETARAIVLLITGLNLDTDILGWMDGEYSFFLFPSRSGLLNSLFPNLGLEAGVILETSNRPTAEKALTALDNLIGAEPISPTPLGDTSVVNWQYDINSDGNPDSLLAHTWLTEDTLALTSGSGAMAQLTTPSGFHPLDDHSTFQNATASFPKPNNGYFYVNMGSTLSFFYNLFNFHQATEPWAMEVRRYLGTMRSLSITTSSSAQQFQIDALLGLAISDNSEPLAAETPTEAPTTEVGPESSSPL